MTSAIDKVRALLAKARDEACGEAEAESCMARARRLMDEHGIEEMQLAGGGEQVGEEHVEVKYLDPWRKVLAHRVASYYGCSTMFFGQDKRFLLVGRRSSREVARSMHEWLDALVLRLAREWRKSVGGTRGEQLNFERACGGRIAERLRVMTKAAVGGGTEVGGGTSVVLVRELAEADAWMKEKYNITTTRVRSRIGGAGGTAGRAAGDAVGLGGQVGGGGGGGGGVRLLG